MRSAPLTKAAPVVARRFLLTGLVQGVGLRPAAARLAARLEVAGTVRNANCGVEIVVEGEPPRVAQFADQLLSALPAEARVDRCLDEATEVTGRTCFTIESSSATGPLSTVVPADRAVCDECLAEVRDPANRRYDYPLTSCTACGPRYSLIEAMPFDRAATTMAPFALCPPCRHEETSLGDRRFHAQTNACPACGPQVWLADADQRVLAAASHALDQAATALRAGKIVALRGVGGYQLLVDATRSEAVARLRRRKRRPSKPLAVMASSVGHAEELAELSTVERTWLTSPFNPIVVVRRRVGVPLAADVAPGMNTVGLLLPTTPLHARLLDRVRIPLVATSANAEGAPLVYDQQTAHVQLAQIADVWLHHNRPIARPIDDSVMRIVAGQPCVLRLGRGLAPLVLPVPNSVGQPLLALGGEMKSALALYNGRQAVLGPHIGELSDAATCQRWDEQRQALVRLYGVENAGLVHDQHPDYFTTRWAEANAQPALRLGVQHHHAHIAAVMLARNMENRPVLGLAWDGAGYGSDGLIWGSECLLVDGPRFTRLAHLRPFAMPGGDNAVREPWRVAVALASEIADATALESLAWPDVDRRQVAAVAQLAGNRRLAPRSTSLGRLFDAVAALALGTGSVEFEGQAAMLLEAAADLRAPSAYPLPLDSGTGHFDWRPLLAAVLDDRRRQTAPGVIAMRFHLAVANMVATIAARYRHLPLVMAGGVFQNQLLGELVAELTREHPAGVCHPGLVPPGDGGLAAGQLAVAMLTWRDHQQT